MKQHTSNTNIAALTPVRCSNCGDAARLVGLEPALGGETLADLCTYECNSCGAVLTRVFLRSAAATAGDRKTTANGNGHDEPPAAM